jgi:hypothetical protein
MWGGRVTFGTGLYGATFSNSQIYATTRDLMVGYSMAILAKHISAIGGEVHIRRKRRVDAYRANIAAFNAIAAAGFRMAS